MKKTIHAILIGINNYDQSPLKGCINDVFQMKSFLDDYVVMNDGFDHKIKYRFLLAPREYETIQEEAGISFLAPTRENIIESFSHFDTASDNDICLFYYSGHGSFQDAHPFFYHTNSRQFETIVCLDSRGNNGRDIVDKELSYLSWKTLEGRENLHFVFIMDCCHSGGVTLNALGNEDELKRLTRKSETNIDYNDFVGFELDESGNSENDFYSLEKDGFGDLIRIHTHPHRMISLGACQADEKSYERRIDGESRGAFTHHLIKALKNGGVKDSYQKLISRVSKETNVLNKQQHPLVNVVNERDKELPFFNTGLIKESSFYPIVIHEKNGVEEWILLAGIAQNIYPFYKGLKPIEVKIIGRNKKNEIKGEWSVSIKNVKATESILDVSNIQIAENQEITRWDGMIAQMSAPTIKIRFNEGIEEKSREQILNEVFDVQYYEIKDESTCFEIIEKENLFYLVEQGKDQILFEGQNDIQVFCECLNHIGKWYSILNLGNENGKSKPSFIKRKNIELVINTLENKYLEADEVNLTFPTTQSYKNPLEITAHYQNEQQPYIHLEIRSLNDTKYKVAVLFFSDDYGIGDLFSPISFKKELSTIYFIPKNQIKNKYCPLTFYSPISGNKAVNYLKFFIFPAGYDIDLKALSQSNLHQMINEVDGMGNELVFRKEMLDWMTFTVKIDLLEN